MSNEPMNNGQEPQTQPTTPEKLFTQDDVNRIIGERLARVKADVSPDLKEREQAVAQKELYLDAREKLADAGLPKELLGALNCATREDMEKSIKMIQGFIGKGGIASAQQAPQNTYRVSMGTPSHSNGCVSHTGADDPDSIRKAMGLKG